MTRKEQQPFYPEPDDEDYYDGNDEPWYDPEDIGCSCTERGIDSEWEWDSEQGCYVCSGCGEVQ